MEDLPSGLELSADWSPQGDTDAESKTTIGQFLATKGALILRETREIGTLSMARSRVLLVQAVIAGHLKAAGQPSNFLRGVRLEIRIARASGGAAFLDYEEAVELSKHLSLIDRIATKLVFEKRDYTEIFYASKDGCKIGFFKTDAEQRAFVHLPGGTFGVFSAESISGLKRLIDGAVSHLDARLAK